MLSKRGACDVCHKRKIQCILPNGESKCEWCTHRGNPCTFNRQRGRTKKHNKRSTRNDAKDVILERIKRIEEITANIGVLKHGENATLLRNLTSSSFEAALVSAERDHHSTVSSTGTTQNNGQIYFSGLQLGTVDSRTGMPSLSSVGADWIFQATGLRPSFEYLGNGGSDVTVTTKDQSTSPRQELGTSSSQKTELPEQSMVKSLLQTFLESDLCLVYPVVDCVLFGDTLSIAYELGNEVTSTERVTAKACVFAFTCFVGVYFGDTELGRSIDVDSYAAESTKMVSEMLEDASLTMLQTMLMLGLYNVVSGRFRTGTMLHATICRTLFTLGGRALVSTPVVNDSPRSLREREDRQLRWIFWLCYVFDKDISLRTGQPCLLHDEFCDLTLPHEYPARHFARETQSHDQRRSPSKYHEGGLLLPCDLRLSIIKSKACRLLYSTGALKKSDAELLRSIRELDEEVEDWRVSLPPNSAPSLSIPKPSTWALGSSIRKSMHNIELHLQYHHLLSVIHHASGRCKSLKHRGTGHDRASILESSLALSVEASRSTLVYLSVAVHGLTSEAAWHIVFYLISALMVLFFNILKNPLHEQATNDLEVISLARDVVKSMPGSRFRPQDANNLGRLDRLISELRCLGQCAIDKAKGK